MREINAKTVQSTALVAVVLLGSLLPVNAIGSHLGHHVWLSIIIAVLPAPLMVWLYSRLSDSGQRRLKMLLAAVLLLLSSYYVLLMLSFWSAFEMRNTPVLVYVLTFACFTFFSARLGRRAIERTASIVVFVFVVAVIGDTLLLMPDYHPRRLLPLAGKIILLILRKLAGNLLQSKHAAGYGLVHGPGVLKMGKELLFPIGKGGDCVHGRPPFPYIKDGFIVPVCAGFVN